MILVGSALHHVLIKELHFLVSQQPALAADLAAEADIVEKALRRIEVPHVLALSVEDRGAYLNKTLHEAVARVVNE